MRLVAVSLAVLTAAILVAARAGAALSPPAEPDDDVPRGMVSFFTGDACPTGWQPPAQAAGRLLVGAPEARAVGEMVGVPLSPEEDRAHEHTVAAASVTLPDKSIAAANGPNQSGAASGEQPITGRALPAPSGLPFVQLTVCVRP